mmetsp:Transcript_130846/g.419613  ORF Transcript_130846/g.419613 Transcript_130846/m.419613 type:complete len:298 (+) Transcript_130846:3447-4340(+)
MPWVKRAMSRSRARKMASASPSSAEPRRLAPSGAPLESTLPMVPWPLNNAAAAAPSCTEAKFRNSSSRLACCPSSSQSRASSCSTSLGYAPGRRCAEDSSRAVRWRACSSTLWPIFRRRAACRLDISSEVDIASAAFCCCAWICCSTSRVRCRTSSSQPETLVRSFSSKPSTRRESEDISSSRPLTLPWISAQRSRPPDPPLPPICSWRRSRCSSCRCILRLSASACRCSSANTTFILYSPAPPATPRGVLGEGTPADGSAQAETGPRPAPWADPCDEALAVLGLVLMDREAYCPGL